MRRVLFDENLPRLLRRKLVEFEGPHRAGGRVGLVQQRELLRRAEGRFDVLLTADRRMQYQQKLEGFDIGVVVIITPRLQLRVLERVLDPLRQALASVDSGEVVRATVDRIRADVRLGG